MKSINSLKVIALSVVASMVLVGCGSDTTSNGVTTSGNDTAEVSTPTVVAPAKSVALFGTAIDPELQGAKVYLDANGNGQYDEGELFAITDEAGKYTLDIPESEIGKPLIVEGGIDRVTKEEFLGRLTLIASSVDGEQFITPLTTIVQEFKAQNPDATLEDVKAELATKLGLADASDLDKDILKDTKLLKIALRIQKIAEKVADTSDKKVKDVYKNIAKGLKEKGFDATLEDVVVGDLNKSSLAYAKLADLNKELKDIDHAGLGYEEFALSVDNIDRNITKTEQKEGLKYDLFDDADMIVSDKDEVRDAQAEKVLMKLGIEDKDGAFKEKLLGDDKIDFKDSLFEKIAQKVEEKGFKIPQGIEDKLKDKPEPKGKDGEMGEQNQDGNQDSEMNDGEMGEQNQNGNQDSEMNDGEMGEQNQDGNQDSEMNGGEMGEQNQDGNQDSEMNDSEMEDNQSQI